MTVSASGWSRLLATGAVLLAAMLLHTLVGALMRRSASDGPADREGERHRFWIRQTARLTTLAAIVGALLFVWAGEGGGFTTVAGLATAGVAVALQRVITAFAAYLIVLRGRIYAVGDRITIGGVRGDVVSLGFMQTSVMEMGEPPSADSGDPKVWVGARQYTGRIVSVTNDKIFDTPVYNYTREFPFMWEEIRVPVKYGADYTKAEQVLLAAAEHHTREVAERATPALARIRARYLMAEDVSLEPRVYLRLTDNWIELTLRFIAPLYGTRALTDAMNRDILGDFQRAGIDVASVTYEIVGLPTIRLAVRGSDLPENEP